MSALRSWRELLMASHRRYTSANGDALASAVTYSVLIGMAPAVLLAGVLVGWAGPSRGVVADLVTEAADRAFPDVVADLVDLAARAPRGLTWVAAAMVVWASVRTIRTLRTSFRAVCGQSAGSGNPIADNLRDGWLAATLYLAAASAVVAVAAGPTQSARWVGLVALWLLVALAMWLLPWPDRGRPAPRYVWSGALVAALLIALLGTVWETYLDHTMAGRERVYGAVAAVVATAVWVALSVRAALRALSLASVLTEWHDEPPADDRPLWVVVPAYHEAAGIAATLAALAAQRDRDFRLVVVDNGSTDGTAAVVRRFAGTAPFPVHVVDEPERGVGCAVDAGMRFAIAHGAELLARTDADALPRPDWTSRIRRRFAYGAEVICGASTPRRDEHPSLTERWVLPAVQRALAIYGRYRGAHRGPELKAPYVLCHGHNLALTAAVYVASGGAVRRRLDAGPEDVELLNRARRHTTAVVRAEDVVVEASLRRLRQWGVRNTFYWYWDRRFRPATEEEVHVR